MWRRARRTLSDRADAWTLRLRAWDRRFLASIAAQPRLKRFSKILVTFTYFGDGYLWLAVLLGLSIFGGPQDRRRSLAMVLVTVLNIAMFRLSKRLTKRVRPDTEAAHTLRFRFLDSYSFPSGHATTSFGMAYMLSIFYPIWPVQVAAFAVAGLIAFSRVYVGEHYPSDVLTGAALGVLVAALLMPLLAVWPLS